MVQDSLFTSPYGKEKEYWSWEVNTHKNTEKTQRTDFENFSQEDGVSLVFAEIRAAKKMKEYGFK